MSFLQPTIPDAVMQNLVEHRAAPPEYHADMGGQYMPGEVTRIPFRGTLLPLSEDDLRRAPQGTYTAMSRKVHTNGYALKEGTRIEDARTGEVYTVVGDLNYGGLSPIRRYIVERKGEASP